MPKNNCLNCLDRVGLDHFSMFKDMNKTIYKRCDGHNVLPKRYKKKPCVPKKRVLRVKDDSYYFPKFIKFIRTGGSLFFRISSPLVL